MNITEQEEEGTYCPGTGRTRRYEPEYLDEDLDDYETQQNGY